MSHPDWKTAAQIQADVGMNLPDQTRIVEWSPANDEYQMLRYEAGWVELDRHVVETDLEN